jgi:hypothetical protein
VSVVELEPLPEAAALFDNDFDTHRDVAATTDAVAERLPELS